MALVKTDEGMGWLSTGRGSRQASGLSDLESKAFFPSSHAEVNSGSVRPS